MQGINHVLSSNEQLKQTIKKYNRDITPSFCQFQIEWLAKDLTSDQICV